MAIVVSMAEYQARETLAVLACAMERAKQGDLEGVYLILQPRDGTEELYLTGTYHRTPGKAVAASVRMCLRLAEHAANDYKHH